MDPTPVPAATGLFADGRDKENRGPDAARCDPPAPPARPPPAVRARRGWRSRGAAARDAARRIEEEMDYPGQIKVTVIRETRAIDYAK